MKYIDTSAFVKYYADDKTEKGSNKIIGLIDEAKIGKEKLISSFFLIGEVVSVFDKWVRHKILTNNESDLIIKRFFADIKQLTDSEGLILEPLNSLSIVFCTELITKYHIPINDAIHLYTALTNKDIIEEFICSDQFLIKAVKDEGFIVYNPEED